MSEIDDKISELEARLDQLVRTQIDFQQNVGQIRYEIKVLRARRQKNEVRADAHGNRPIHSEASRPPVGTAPSAVEPENTVPEFKEPAPAGSESSWLREEPLARDVPPASVTEDQVVEESVFARYAAQYAEAAKANLEEFIGENLISKAGIVVLLLGIGIGVKYAIDNDLISPLTRIIIGYILGFGLIGLGVRLKAKYENFSAILLSGGMASLYFVTYFAYSLYGLIGQPVAFALMVMFTVFTVASALIYNKQVIAHIGLVGAYAAPFLLSTGSAAYAFLFTYMSIVNAGILTLSIRRAWRPIIYTSSAFTWLIFAVWLTGRFSAYEQFSLALTFLWVFAAVFYAANIFLTRRDAEANDVLGRITAWATVSIFFAFCLFISDSAITVTQSIFLFSYLAATTLILQVTANVRAIRIPGSDRLLFYIAAGFTWTTLFAWFIDKYSPTEHLIVAMIFVGVFFAISYGTSIYHSLDSAGADTNENTIVAVVNILIFFAFSFGISQMNPANDEIAALFTYVAIASVVILVTSYKYYGRIPLMVAYPFTWLIFGVWFSQYYDPDSNLFLSAGFAAVFFLVFYAMTLAYRLTTASIGLAEHSALLLTNSFVFYGFGYGMLDTREDLRGLQGLFTAGHGMFHFLVAYTVGRARENVSDLIQVLTILIITFLTLAIPVQFDGNYVTMVWAIEGALLFWFARTRQIRLFECYSYPVLTLAFGSMVLDWIYAFEGRTGYPSDVNLQVFANGNFITALIVIAAFAFVFITNRDKQHEPTVSIQLVRPIGFIAAGIALTILFNAFRTEIDNYFHLRISAARMEEARLASANLGLLNAIWQMIYTAAFLTVLNSINLRRAKSVVLGAVGIGLSLIILAILLSGGSWILFELRENYISGGHTPAVNIFIRYIAYFAASVLLYSLYRVGREPYVDERLSRSAIELVLDAMVAITIFVFASGELLSAMAQNGILDSTKYGLSVLWGFYALALIAFGIKWGKKHLRIGGIVLIGITLLKLFLYDIADLPTIPKTILFVSLGILMLIVSFLYTKYKHVIVGEREINEEL
jgi:uncharacterized membrane protein